VLGLFKHGIESRAVEIFALGPHGLNLRGVVNIRERIGCKENEIRATPW
jgi:hypothetical protein